MFTGRNAGILNMREGKVDAPDGVARRRGHGRGQLVEATFYSDSINDLPLLGAVGKPVAVDPDSRLEAEAARRRGRCCVSTGACAATDRAVSRTRERAATRR